MRYILGFSRQGSSDILEGPGGRGRGVLLSQLLLYDRMQAFCWNTAEVLGYGRKGRETLGGETRIRSADQLGKVDK